MHIWGVLGDPKNASKIPPCRGDSLLERERVLERSRDGVREGPGEKRRSDDARAPGVDGIGATRCRAKALGRTGSALDHGGVAGFPRISLAKLCFAARSADPPIGSPGTVFLGWSTMKVIFGCILKLNPRAPPPPLRMILGTIFGPASSTQFNWAFVSHSWTHQHTSDFGGVLEPNMCGAP